MYHPQFPRQSRMPLEPREADVDMSALVCDLGNTLDDLLDAGAEPERLGSEFAALLQEATLSAGCSAQVDTFNLRERIHRVPRSAIPWIFNYFLAPEHDDFE